MGLTGKYDFAGIRKAGTAALNAVLATTGFGASILASPFRPLITLLEGAVVNYLANKGLLIINLTAIYIDGKLDQNTFDSAMDDALQKIQIQNLTDEQKKAIDNEVIDAFRKFAPVAKPK